MDVTGVLSYDGGENNNSESERNPDSSQKPLSRKRRRSTHEEEFTDVEYLNDRTVQFSEIDDDDPLFEELEEIVAEPAHKIKEERSTITQLHVGSPVKSQPSSAYGVDDEYTLFGKLIAEKLRRMPKSRANRLEMKVMALLLIGDE